MNVRTVAALGVARACKSSRTVPDSGGAATAGSAPALRVLVVGTDDWAIEAASTELEAGSCEVLRCHEPGQPPFPCNALVAGRTCPLDAGFDVVADMRARPSGSLEQSEFGVICALHHGRPLVVAGVAADVPLGPWAVTAVGHGGSLVEACKEVVGGKLSGAAASAPGRRSS